MKKKRICFFVADITFKGGIERVLSNLTSGLADYQDLDLTIVSQYKSHSEPNYKFNGKVKIEYISDDIYSGKPRSFGRLVNHLKNIQRIRNYFKEHEFDEILAQSFVNTFLLYLSGITLSKVIAVEHVYWGYYPSFIQKVRTFIYPKCKNVVVLTKYDYEYYSSFLNNVKLIPNPIKSNKVKPHYNIESKTIIAIGRLEEQKGFSDLIKCFKKIALLYPQWELHIFGEGNLYPVLKSIIIDNQLENNVKLMGTTADIASKLRESSFLVMSSKFEGFGMVLLEAMNEGVPCISFNCPAGPADILDNKFGVLVDNQNFPELVSRISYFISNPKIRKEYSDLAFSRVSYYGIDNIARQWEQLL